MAVVSLLPMRDLPFFEMAIMLIASIVLKGRAGRLWRPLCESGGLLVHPTLAIISAFKESHWLVAAGLGAEELASEQLAGASIAEVCCPEPEALARGNKLHAPLSAFRSAGTPPLPLSGGEGSHGEDKTVSHWKKKGEARASLEPIYTQKGPDGPFVAKLHTSSTRSMAKSGWSCWHTERACSTEKAM